MVALPEPRPETPRQRKKRESIENVQRSLLGRQLMFDELSPAGQAARRAEVLPTLKGIGVGIPATIVGLPADIIGLPAVIGELLANLTGQDPNAVYKELAEMSPEERDANLLSLAQSPQEYAALSEFFNSLGRPVPAPKPRPTGEEEEDDDDLIPPMLRITRDIQKAAGAEGIARLAGFGDDFEDPNFRQGFTASEVLTPIPLLDFGIPALMKRGSRSTDLVSDTPQVGFTGEVELPEEIAQQPTRLQSTGDISLSDLPRSEVTGLPVLRTEVTERMATPEETAAFIRGEDPAAVAPTGGTRDPMSTLAGMTIDDIPVVNLPESRPGRGDEVEVRDFTPNEEFDIQNVFEVEADSIHGPTGVRVPEGTFVRGNFDDFEVVPPRFTSEQDGIAGLPAAEDVIDVEPLVTAAARTDTDVGNPVEASRQAYPITEEIATLPDAPVEPLPVQGEIADYTPVYRALTLLDENQTYTPGGLVQLLESLPTSARRDLYNLGAIDDPMVVPLNEANYDKYLKSKNQDKSFSEFTTERNASQRPAPEFIKLKENADGSLVFKNEIKKQADIQKEPQSALLTVLKDMDRLTKQAGTEPLTLNKTGILQLYNDVSPQVAVKSIQVSDVARPPGMDDPEYLQMLQRQDVAPKTAVEVIQKGGIQSPFKNNDQTNPTVMIFNNPGQTSFLGNNFKGVPGHDYFGGIEMVPGYFAHARYDVVLPMEEVQPGVFQPTGERFAGFIEGQSNLQSAKRGTGKDADRLSNSRIESLDPYMSLFMRSVEKELAGTGMEEVTNKLTLLNQTEDIVKGMDSPLEDIELAKTTAGKKADFSEITLRQEPSEYGSNGGLIDVMATQARELSDIMDSYGYLGDQTGFIDFIRNSGTDAADNAADEVADIFINIANDFTVRNGMTNSDFRIYTGIDSNLSKSDLIDNNFKEGTPLYESLFDLAKAGGQAGTTPLRESLDIPENAFQRGVPIERSDRDLENRIRDAETFSMDERRIIVNLVKRDDIDEDTVLDLLDGKGTFEGSPITYKKIMQTFRSNGGSDGAGTAVVLALKGIAKQRVSERAEALGLVNEVLLLPEALSDLQALGRPPENTDILRIFLKHASDDDLKTRLPNASIAGPLYSRLGILGNKQGDELKNVYASNYLTGQAGKDLLSQDAAVFDKAASPDNLMLLSSNTEYSNALGMQKLARENVIDEAVRVTGNSIPLSSSSRLVKDELGKFASSKIKEAMDDGKIVTHPDYGEDELLKLVKDSAAGKSFGTNRFAVPTAFGNPAQLSHYMYRSFIQDAVKNGYDGVVFPSWQAQKDAHNMPTDEVAKLTYEKSLKEALDIIRKEHPEFPSYDNLVKSSFQYKKTVSDRPGTISDDSVVLRFTPEIRAIFEGRVIRRAKGGEVDLRPRKMIHSGIGAMAREVM